MLGLAVSKLPYGYFVLLRWVVGAAAVFVIVVAYYSRQYWACWLYGLVLLVFNPVMPFRLGRGMWRPVDLAGAVLMLLAVILVRRGAGEHREVRNRQQPNEHSDETLPGGMEAYRDPRS